MMGGVFRDYEIELKALGNHVRELRFESGAGGNAMTLPLAEGLLRCLAELEHDHEDLRVLVVRGGERSFCAGADLKAIAEWDDDTYSHYVETEFQLFAALDRLPVVTVAAMQGACFGNAAELALACDFRIAHEACRYGFTETRVGFQGPAQRLTHFVGIGVAKRLLFDGEILSAAEAHELGLITEVASADVFDEQVERAAARYAALPAVAVRVMKRNLAAAYPITHAMEESEKASSFETFHTQDAREGFASFFEKRSPVFRGR
jgi:enoyl-CoA hydratase/carnithine racemase